MGLVSHELCPKVQKENGSNERNAKFPHSDWDTIGLWGGQCDGSDPAIGKKDPNPWKHWWTQNNNFIQVYRKKWEVCKIGY